MKTLYFSLVVHAEMEEDTEKVLSKNPESLLDIVENISEVLCASETEAAERETTPKRDHLANLEKLRETCGWEIQGVSLEQAYNLINNSDMSTSDKVQFTICLLS